MTDKPISQRQTGQQHEHEGRSRFTNGVKRRLTSPSWLARTAGIALSSVSIGFVVLFMSALGTGGEATLFTRPLTMQIALTLPYLIGLLTLGTTAGSLVAWRHRYWSFSVRIHQTVLALLGIAFSWQLSTLGFIQI